VKHTPGPWHQYIGYDTGNSIAVSYDVPNRGLRATICSMPSPDKEVHRTQEQINANAHLIAAAPEMLEALDDMVTEMYEQGLLDVLDESSRAFKVLKQRLANAEKAIAKARGEK
jgi:hypothetical protein